MRSTALSPSEPMMSGVRASSMRMRPLRPQTEVRAALHGLFAAVMHAAETEAAEQVGLIDPHPPQQQAIAKKSKPNSFAVRR